MDLDEVPSQPIFDLEVGSQETAPEAPYFSFEPIDEGEDYYALSLPFMSVPFDSSARIVKTGTFVDQQGASWFVLVTDMKYQTGATVILKCYKLMDPQDRESKLQAWRKKKELPRFSRK